MTRKRLVALLGFIFFLVGLRLTLSYTAATQQAAELDRSYREITPYTPQDCRRATKAAVELERRVMAENETQTLIVTLTNPAEGDCDVTLLLYAPFFATNPPVLERQVTVPRGSNLEVAWILTPHRLGTFELMLRFNGSVTTIGVTVTNILGLRAWQVELLSRLSTFLGPALTLPYWLEVWQKRRPQGQHHPLPGPRAKSWIRLVAAPDAGRAPARRTTKEADGGMPYGK